MKRLSTLILAILALAVAAALYWVLLQPTRNGDTVPPADVTVGNSPVTDGDTASKPFLSGGQRPTATPAAATPAQANDPAPELPPLSDFEREELRIERTDLRQVLSTNGDPMLPDVTAALAERRIEDPVGVASAWVLAQRWGVYLRAEEDPRLAKVEDPKQQELLAQARRRVLLDEPTRELKSFLGDAVDESLLADLERIGRRYATNAIAVPQLPGQPDRRDLNRQRRVKLPMEE